MFNLLYLSDNLSIFSAELIAIKLSLAWALDFSKHNSLIKTLQYLVIFVIFERY